VSFFVSLLSLSHFLFFFQFSVIVILGPDISGCGWWAVGMWMASRTGRELIPLGILRTKQCQIECGIWQRYRRATFAFTVMWQEQGAGSEVGRGSRGGVILLCCLLWCGDKLIFPSAGTRFASKGNLDTLSYTHTLSLSHFGSKKLNHKSAGRAHWAVYMPPAVLLLLLPLLFVFVGVHRPPYKIIKS